MPHQNPPAARTAAELGQQLASLLMPHLNDARNEFRKSDRQFVHYTTGGNALSIIRTKRFWLRSTVCMNDFSEVQHGYNMMLNAFHENDAELRTRFCAAVDAACPGAAMDAINRFDQYFEINRYRVFVGCLSEHHPDDHLGRLSMWRAYGKGSTPVALVLNKERLFIESDSTNIFMSPVVYLRDQEVKSAFNKIIAQLAENTEFLKSINPEILARSLFAMLLFTAICLKHPGFSEEREWRLIYLPSFARSPIIEEEIETVNGVPQQVYKVPLQDRPDHNITGIEIRDLLRSLIIGPTQFPFPVSEAFIDLLYHSGVPDAHKKVYSASIPLRT